MNSACGGKSEAERGTLLATALMGRGEGFQGEIPLPNCICLDILRELYTMVAAMVSYM